MRNLIAAAALAAALAAPAAAVELIKNGGFETTTATASSQFGDRFASVDVSGWGADGLTVLYFPGAADTTGGTTEYGVQDLKVYGPGNGHPNGMPAASPLGGNFVMMDGDTSPALRGTISQTVTGLQAGKRYTLSFYLAGGQQLNYPGDTFDKYVDVSFGGKTLRSDVLAGPEGSFQPWRKQVMSFTASDSTEVLKFLAHGQPNGLPPLVFVDGVSMTAAVPEPATWAMLILGFGMVGHAMRRRREGAAQVIA